MTQDGDILVDPEAQSPGHEETIVPVKPALMGVSPTAPRDDEKRTRRTPVLGIGAGVLVVLAVGVFFVLPDWVTDQQAQEPVAEEVQPETLPEPEGPSFTPEELEALLEEAESLLALILPPLGAKPGL